MNEVSDTALQLVFRQVMSRVCTPVSVVTAMSGGRPHGTTVSAFASLSMRPAMALVALDRNSDLLSLLRVGHPFGVNVLSSSQSQLALNFARKGGVEKFKGLAWHVEAGVPRIPQSCGFFACEVQEMVGGGDHVIVLGLVVAAATDAGPPLTYYSRAFGTHVPVDGVAREPHVVC